VLRKETDFGEQTAAPEDAGLMKIALTGDPILETRVLLWRTAKSGFGECLVFGNSTARRGYNFPGERRYALGLLLKQRNREGSGTSDLKPIGAFR
jgi:hypothetical protein